MLLQNAGMTNAYVKQRLPLPGDNILPEQDWPNHWIAQATNRVNGEVWESTKEVGKGMWPLQKLSPIIESSTDWKVYYLVSPRFICSSMRTTMRTQPDVFERLFEKPSSLLVETLNDPGLNAEGALPTKSLARKSLTMRLAAVLEKRIGDLREFMLV